MPDGFSFEQAFVPQDTQARGGPLSPEKRALGNAIYSGLTARGMDSDSAWGYAANGVGESGGKTYAVNPESLASGTFQWLGARKDRYRALYGHLPHEGDLDEHLDYVMWENNGPEAEAWRKIQATKGGGPAKAAAIAQHWERFGDVPGEIDNRSWIARHLIGGAQAATPPRAAPVPFSFDDAKKPSQSQGFSFDEAKTPANGQVGAEQGTWDVPEVAGQAAPEEEPPDVFGGSERQRKAWGDFYTNQEPASPPDQTVSPVDEYGTPVAAQAPVEETPKPPPEMQRFGWSASEPDMRLPEQNYVEGVLNAGSQSIVAGSGRAVSGLGEAYQEGQISAGQRMLQAMDQVDKGDVSGAVKPLTQIERGVLSQYIRAKPEDRERIRTQTQADTDDLVKRDPNMVTRAGQEVTRVGLTRYPVSPANEGIGTEVAGAIGGVVPLAVAGVAGSLVGGPAGAVAATLPIIGGQSFNATRHEALQKGATPDEAAKAAGISALTQMGIMALPIGRVVRATPELAAPLAQAIVELGKRGVEFGSFAAISKFADNFVAKEMFDPKRELMEGVLEAAAVGALAGGAMAVPGVLRGRGRITSTQEETFGVQPQPAPGLEGSPESTPPPRRPQTPEQAAMDEAAEPPSGLPPVPPRPPREDYGQPNPRRPPPPTRAAEQANELERPQPVSEPPEPGAGPRSAPPEPGGERAVTPQGEVGLPEIVPEAGPLALPSPAEPRVRGKAPEPGGEPIALGGPQPIGLPAPEEPRVRGKAPEPGGEPIALGGPDEPAAPSTAPEIIEHTTAKGKVLRGVVRTDLTQAEAKAIDPYSFKKNGGFFIREKNLPTAEVAPVTPEPGQRWAPVGQNADGNPVFEDANGVRSFTHNGVRTTEPVQMRPTRAGVKPSVPAVGQKGPEFEVAEPVTQEPSKQYEYNQNLTAPGEIAANKLAVDVLNGIVPKETAVTELGRMVREGALPEGVAQVNLSRLGGVTEGEWTKAKNAPTEHPGIVIQSLETGKRTVIQPPGTVPPGAIPPKAIEPTTPSGDPDHQFANALATNLSDPNYKPTARDLHALGQQVYGGTLGTGGFTRDRLYDAIELGVNRYIQQNPEHFAPTGDAEQAKAVAAELAALKDRIPTQTVRAGEKDTHQQFSTPPDYAYSAAWVANLRPTDRVLEPSAGTGGLIVHAMNAGVQDTHVNELSEKRRSMLGALNPGTTHGEDATQLHNILPDTVKPTVVLMNPPFSAAAGRMGNKMVLGEGARHVEQALARLESGGRLVAIVGRGMAPGTPTFRDWWRKIGAQYDVRANLGVEGDIYRKYGTTFPTRILVIDKAPPSGRKLIDGSVKTAGEIIDALKGIRDERPETDRGAVQPVAGEPTGVGVAPAGEGTGGPGNLVSGPTGIVGPGTGRGNAPANASEPTRSEQPGDRGELTPATGEPGVAPGNAVVSPEPEPKPGGTDVVPGRTTPTGDLTPGSSPTGVGSGVRPDGRGELNDPGVIPPPELTVKTETAVTEPHNTELTEAVYESYTPQRVKIEGSKPHPGALVQSAAMASVQPPKTDYRPRIAPGLIKSGALSDAQLEAVVYAGHAHGQMLPAEGEEKPKRRGMFIGDGTGVGKGREIAGIILDNWNQGRKKAIWVSENLKLLNDAKRDWSGMGRDPNEIVSHQKTKASDPIKLDQGILFTGYDTLKSAEQLQTKTAAGKAAKGKTRVDQIVDWVGKDFDGVIAFDEAHNMANAIPMKGTRGTSKPSAKALAGVELQSRLPNARVVYISATGATEVSNLAYADRLGLWGRGTPFPNRNDFLSKINQGGIAGMELVARDMKALGHYIARNLSYDGVEYNRLEHKLTGDQRATYDKLAEGWQVVLQNFEAALVETEGGKKARSATMAQFWGTHQRFFNQIITSMQIPTVIKSVEKDIKEGRQAVLQLVNTMEAAQERAVEKAKQAGEDLEDLDMTPRDQLMQMVEKSFPVAQWEDFIDENGNKGKRPVLDAKGNPVLNKKAVAMRERLLDQLGSLRVPDGPLEILFNHFGPDTVAEVTGRGQRVVRKRDETGQMKSVLERRGANANISEANDFQGGKKKILVFSQAGGTGRSYHDAKDAVRDESSRHGIGGNSARRSHYLVQAGWIAAKAVQGFGRTHRTNQHTAPIFHLVTTDLDGQKRFISSIARRLGQLGALTKGERRTGDQGLFGLKDNLESGEARTALESFFKDLDAGKVPGLTIADIERSTGLRLRNENGALEVPQMSQFLNRLLSFKVDEQNMVFREFADRLDTTIDRAAAAGTLDTGLETYKADRIEKKGDTVVYTDPNSGAETRHVQLEAKNKNRPASFKDLMTGKHMTGGNKPRTFVQNRRSGRVYALTDAHTYTNKDGAVIDQYRLTSPLDYQFIDRTKLNKDNWSRVVDEGQAKDLWDKQVAATPEYRTSDIHLITGAVLPIWDRLGGSPKIFRLQTSDGERMLGRVIPDDLVDHTLEALGAEKLKVNATPEQIGTKVLDGGVAHLANGWTIKRSLVGGEQRLELVGPSYTYDAQLKNDGVFTERINYKTRYFIPSGELAPSVIEKITTGRPVTQLTNGRSGEGNVAFSRRGPGGDAPLQAGALRSRGEVRRGAAAMIDRLRLQANLDAARDRRSGSPGMSVVDRDSIRKVEDFIDFIGEHMFSDVGLRILRGPAGVLGQYNAARHTVSLFRESIDRGNASETLVHEFWHSLERVLPPEDRAALTAEFQRQQAKWLRANEWARPFLRDGEIRDSLSGKEARDWMSAHGDDPKADRLVEIRGMGDGTPRVRMKWTGENYRYKNRSEYFAETMTDRHFDDRDIQDAKARSVFAHIRDIWRRMVVALQRLFGYDSTGRIYEGFRARDYAPGVDHGLMTGMEIAEARGPRTGALGSASDVIRTKQGIPKAVAEFKAMFAPTSLKGAKPTEQLIRRHGAEQAQSFAQAVHKLEKVRDAVDAADRAEQIEITDRMEHGDPQPTPELQAAATALREVLDKTTRDVQSLGRGYLENAIQDYMGHVYGNYHEWAAGLPAPTQAEMDAAARAAGQGKRPLQGSKAFLKRRSFPTQKEAIDAGLIPVTYNPIDLQLLKIREMQKFYHGTRLADQMKESGIAKWVPAGHEGDARASGLEKLDDRVFQPRLQGSANPAGFGRLEPGNWYATESAARIFNNYMSRGLAGQSVIYDTIRAAGNAMNSLQLGLSGFHATFVALDTMKSRAALGLNQIAWGQYGRGARSLALGMTPASLVQTVRTGSKLRNAWLDPSNATPEWQHLADSLNAGGGRINMDQFYRNTTSGSFFKHLTDMAHPSSVFHQTAQMFRDEPATWKKIALVPLRIAGRVLDTMMEPLMGQLVPRAKLGVFADLAKSWQDAHPNATPEQRSAAMIQFWDSVDNRLGQLVYDNLYWAKVQKDIAFITTRSVGWNIGTVRELGGGVVDTAKLVSDIAQGKAPELTTRMAYSIVMPIVTAIYGALLTYLATGAPPQEMLDYFFPPTGTKDQGGNPERRIIPGYEKDVIEYTKAPLQTVLNKLHPLLSTLAELHKNEDYYGGIIYNPTTDNPAAAYGDYLLNQHIPFSWRGWHRLEQQGAPMADQMLAFWGIQPAPKSITQPERGEMFQQRRDLRAYRKREREPGRVRIFMPGLEDQEAAP